MGVSLPGCSSWILIASFRDGALAPDLRCAIAHRGISRFSDVQLHIGVRCCASPRNDKSLPINDQALVAVKLQAAERTALIEIADGIRRQFCLLGHGVFAKILA